MFVIIKKNIAYVVCFFQTRRISAHLSCVTTDCLPYLLSVLPDNIRKQKSVFMFSRGIGKEQQSEMG